MFHTQAQCQSNWVASSGLLPGTNAWTQGCACRRACRSVCSVHDGQHGSAGSCNHERMPEAQRRPLALCMCSRALEAICADSCQAGPARQQLRDGQACCGLLSTDSQIHTPHHAGHSCHYRKPLEPAACTPLQLRPGAHQAPACTATRTEQRSRLGHQPPATCTLLQLQLRLPELRINPPMLHGSAH